MIIYCVPYSRQKHAVTKINGTRSRMKSLRSKEEFLTEYLELVLFFTHDVLIQHQRRIKKPKRNAEKSMNSTDEQESLS